MKKQIMAFFLTAMCAQLTFAADACQNLQDRPQETTVNSETFEASRSYWVGIGSGDFSSICGKVVAQCRDAGFSNCYENHKGWTYTIFEGATMGQKCTTYGTKKIRVQEKTSSICEKLSSCMISLLSSGSEFSADKLGLVNSLIAINHCGDKGSTVKNDSQVYAQQKEKEFSDRR
jgi:hypothetical protein